MWWTTRRRRLLRRNGTFVWWNWRRWRIRTTRRWRRRTTESRRNSTGGSSWRSRQYLGEGSQYAQGHGHSEARMGRKGYQSSDIRDVASTISSTYWRLASDFEEILEHRSRGGRSDLPYLPCNESIDTDINPAQHYLDGRRERPCTHRGTVMPTSLGQRPRELENLGVSDETNLLHRHLVRDHDRI